ncbi:MAG: prepilin peptidase [Paracoccaceae bacterium]
MMTSVSVAVGILALAQLAHLAWHDFWHLKIRNKAVLALLVTYIVWAALNGFSSFKVDLAIAALLALPALLMWLFRLLGAGDVKLYFVLGLMLGFSHVGIFVILLLLVTILFQMALWIAARGGEGGAIKQRMRFFKTGGKAPYGVVICLAALLPVLMRMTAGT